jgi:hypothetical protein
MRIEVFHKLTKEEATRRMKSLVDTLKEEYAGEIDHADINWGDHGADFRLKARGYTIDGTGYVTMDQVVVDLDLPFMLRMFSSKVEKPVREAIEKTLSKES